MCLKTEELNMKYDCVKKKYIGIGYKSCNTYDNEIGRASCRERV